MGDDYYCAALSFHLFKDSKELFRFLRGKHGGRLVKDKYFCASVKDFKYLHRLLFADGHIIYLFVGVNFQPQLFGYLVYLVPYSSLAFKAALCACNDVVRCGEHLHQLEVLMYHAYSQCNGVLG